MKSNGYFLLAAARALAFVPIPIGAQNVAPSLVPVQGYLTDSDSEPVDGDGLLVFSIYDVAEGGTPLFTEEQTVSVEQGYFTAYLEEMEALDLRLFKDNELLFLGVKISNNDEATLRIRLATASYAAFAQYCGDAATLNGHASSDLQQRVNGSCDNNEYIRAISEDGSVSCRPSGFLDCIAVRNSFDASGNQSAEVSASCDSDRGYLVTGGGCYTEDSNSFSWSTAQISDNGYRCQGEYPSANLLPIFAQARCCRLDFPTPP